METGIIRAGIGRGRWHQSRDTMKEFIWEPLFEDLRKLNEDLHVPRYWREWALIYAFKLKPIGGGTIGDTFENDLGKLIFNAIAIANLAQDGTTPKTTLGISLHTADPGEAGNQTTSACTYTNYARAVCARDNTTASRWVLTANVANPNAAINFPLGGGGSGTATYFGIGTETDTSAGKLLFSGTVTPNIVTGSGVTPQLTTASSVTFE